MAQVGNHRNLVSIVGVVTSGNPLVLVVAFCEFGSLLSVLLGAAAESNPVPVDLKLKVAVDIAAGMDFLHECSYIHRDLAGTSALHARVAPRRHRSTRVLHGVGVVVFTVYKYIFEC